MIVNPSSSFLKLPIFAQSALIEAHAPDILIALFTAILFFRAWPVQDKRDLGWAKQCNCKEGHFSSCTGVGAVL
jgi:hypothetical protein